MVHEYFQKMHILCMVEESNETQLRVKIMKTNFHGT